MSEQVVLFGSGTVGRFIGRWLTAQGTPPVYFADNDPGKWDTVIEGITVQSPAECQRSFPNATWVATVLHTPYPTEIQEQILQMGVKSEPLSTYLSIKRAPLGWDICHEISKLCADRASREEMWDQWKFRKTGQSSAPFLDVKDVYFPDFIQKLDDEVFVDCGAADGDTVVEVLKRWPSTVRIISFEPDPQNFASYQSRKFGDNVMVHRAAIGDHDGDVSFTVTGDQTAHIKTEEARDYKELQSAYVVPLWNLDNYLFGEPPTFIKMDIEGFELEGLWGARNLIQKHSPVLAICAYHTDDHIWQIPLLIHALNPNYKLYLRRYLEQPWEMVWYAVPAERVK